MERRIALLTVLSTLAAFIRGTEARAGQTTIYRPPAWTEPEPLPLVFSLDSFKEYRFTLGTREVVFTPQQIMEILDPSDTINQCPDER